MCGRESADLSAGTEASEAVSLHAPPDRPLGELRLVRDDDGHHAGLEAVPVNKHLGTGYTFIFGECPITFELLNLYVLDTLCCLKR